MIFDEANFPELPESWISLPVGEACINLPIRDKTPTTGYLPSGCLAVIDQGAKPIGGYVDDLGKSVTDDLPVIVFGDHTRVIKFIDFPFAAGADGIKVLKPTACFSPKFFYYTLRTIRLPDKGYSRHFQYLHASKIPLAPFNEQKRIADKLDALLARVDACRERLDRVSLILKRFRQAVLAAATAGRLTKDWREESRTCRPSSASIEELQEFTFEDAACFGAYRFPSCWGVVRLQEIADVDGGVTKDTKKQNPLDEELPYLRVANVQRGFLDLSEVKTIRVPSQRIEDLLLKPGDILFNEGGDLDKLGRGWVWSGEIERCTFQNHVFRVRLHDATFEPKFFSWYGNSRGFDYFVQSGKQTTNLASINKTLLSALPVVVPSADEQREIVRRVEGLFDYADRLEARYQAARAQVERLTPSLLAKAFRGELVPQDPDDEPASVLLERIRAERASAAAQPKQSRRRPTMEQKVTTRKIPAGSAGIIHVLREAGRELSAKDLFAAAGYPPDADPEKVEAFFVAVRDALKQGQITRERRRDMDWFSLAPQ
jgi:restriction endonuclease S subunit